MSVNGSSTGVVELCVSVTGRMVFLQNCRVRVAYSSFGRTDWVTIGERGTDMQIEIEDIQFGNTTNNVGAGKPQRIPKQRITNNGTFNYVLEAVR